MDKVFILGLDEILNYYNFEHTTEGDTCNYSSALISPPTDYAKNNGVFWRLFDQESYDEGLVTQVYGTDIIGKEGANWWLRSPGWSAREACVVHDQGSTGWFEYARVYGDPRGVRPALYITQ